MEKYKNQHLKKILSSHFIKFSLLPILIVEITLLILYFSINKYISIKNTDLLLNEAQVHSKDLLKKEASIINNKLSSISDFASILQKEHESIFLNPDRFGLPNKEPQFAVADNKVFYKTNKIGSSLYYSAKTKITDEERSKAIFTEAMDPTLKNIVDVNPLVVAAYFNSWDNMNRLYPFIDDVFAQYGEHIQMEDYNFYYLADKKHNPLKKAVWTGAYLDPAGQGWMLSCIVPIYKNEFLEGVTGIDITIDSFVKNILDQKLPYDAKLFMVDNDGMILAMPERIEELLGLKELKEHLYTDSILKTIEKPEDYNLLKNESPFATKFRNLIKSNISDETLNINDKEYLAIAQNVNETNWKLMILIDKDEIFISIKKLEELSNKIGYIAIALLLLFYVIFFTLLLRRINIFSHKITQPLVDLSEQTTLMSKEDLEFRKLDTNVIEISQLSNNFILMMNKLKEKTKKLYDAKVYAEEANKAKDDFLANMSHELKTPLNSINIISTVMAENKAHHLNEKEVKNLEIINKCGKDLVYLINDILDLSKLDAKEMKLVNKTINIRNLICIIYENFYSQVKEKGLEFNLEIDKKLNLMYSDETRISQIVRNLLSNSLKFTQKGKISLIVEDHDTEIKIIVQDDGIGISKEKFEAIFDRFKQVDASTTRKYGGTGLGLSICKEITALLGGKITVKSEENLGSTFEVLLPKNQEMINNYTSIYQNKKENISNKKSDDLNVSVDSDLKENTAKSKILVLNNDPMNFFNIIIELKKKYDVKQALNLTQLLALKNKNNYEKVLVDISKLNTQEKELLSSNLSDNTIIIFENEKDEFLNNATSSMQKPITLELIKTI